METLSSPHRVVCEYFSSLRRLTILARDAETEPERRQFAAVAVVMSITAAEVFVNTWFRVRVSEMCSPKETAEFLSELGQPRPWSLDKKLKNWPKRYIGKELDLTANAGAQFIKVKTLRNSIVHFTSSHTSFRTESVQIHGLADTTNYDGLTFEHARDALFAAEDLVQAILLLAGASDREIPYAMAQWTGRVPNFENAA